MGHDLKPDQHYKASAIIAIATSGNTIDTMEPNWRSEFKLNFPELKEVLLKEACARNGRDIDPKRFGKWLARLNGQVHGGWRIVKVRSSKGHGMIGHCKRPLPKVMRKAGGVKGVWGVAPTPFI